MVATIGIGRRSILPQLWSRAERSIPLTPLVQPPVPWERDSGSRRQPLGLVIERDPVGEIVNVRIGRRRAIGASPQRRISEVRELAGQRIAVRFDLTSGPDRAPTSIVWQLYDNRGRIVAAMQVTPDGRHAVLTCYETRRVCRLVRGDNGQMRDVEQWRM